MIRKLEECVKIARDCRLDSEEDFVGSVDLVGQCNQNAITLAMVIQQKTEYQPYIAFGGINRISGPYPKDIEMACKGRIHHWVEIFENGSRIVLDISAHCPAYNWFHGQPYIGSSLLPQYVRYENSLIRFESNIKPTDLLSYENYEELKKKGFVRKV